MQPQGAYPDISTQVILKLTDEKWRSRRGPAEEPRILGPVNQMEGAATVGLPTTQVILKLTDEHGEAAGGLPKSPRYWGPSIKWRAQPMEAYPPLK